MAFLFKLASSFNSDFSLLLPTGEHLFACQNVCQGGRKHVSISGRSWALRYKQLVPSQGPLPTPHLSHQEEGESESFQRKNNAWRKLVSQGFAPVQYSCTALGECVHVSLSGHAAAMVHVCCTCVFTKGQSSEELQVKAPPRLLASHREAPLSLRDKNSNLGLTQPCGFLGEEGPKQSEQKTHHLSGCWRRGDGPLWSGCKWLGGE